jgi:pimeloyl-ACP methyl ester carboxylesterase
MLGALFQEREMDYVFTVRNIRKGAFGDEPAAARYLTVPEGAAAPRPEHETKPRKDWVEAVLQDALNGQNPITMSLKGDILFFVHGFNIDQAEMLKRHRAIKKGLAAEGWDGAVVSFDWPTAGITLNYLEDRTDAKESALVLVNDGIRLFAAMQEPLCEINLHVVAHSMGAYLVREAFDDADDRAAIAAHAWTVSQMALLSADVSASSMAEGNARSSSLYRHVTRLTNYANPFDVALSISNAKRLGTAPRAGRVGLPPDAPGKAVNIDTGTYYQANKAKFDGLRNPDHIWYFWDPILMRDLAFTLKGEIDRSAIPTRGLGPGGLFLRG